MPDTTVTVAATGVGSDRTFGQMKDYVTYGYAIVGSSSTPGSQIVKLQLAFELRF